MRKWSIPEIQQLAALVLALGDCEEVRAVHERLEAGEIHLAEGVTELRQVLGTKGAPHTDTKSAVRGAAGLVDRPDGASDVTSPICDT